MAKFTRLLNLTAALINTATPLTAEEIRERVPGYPDTEVAFHRAFERDKDELREIGIPIETTTAIHIEPPRAAYTIDNDRYSLPDPRLTPEELAALHLATSAVRLEGLDPGDASDALRKLGGIEGSAEGDIPAIGTLQVSPELASLLLATTERREVSFTYSDEVRRLRPYRLQFERSNWYVSGHDLERDASRSFRVDRISGPVTSGPPGSFERPAEARGVITNPWELGKEAPVSTLVHIDRGPAQATLAEYPGISPIATHDDGSVDVILEVRNQLGLWHFMANLLDRAEILEPRVMRDEFVGWLERFEAGSVS